jgi:hypothetical protein
VKTKQLIRFLPTVENKAILTFGILARARGVVRGSLGPFQTLIPSTLCQHADAYARACARGVVRRACERLKFGALDCVIHNFGPDGAYRKVEDVFGDIATAISGNL